MWIRWNGGGCVTENQAANEWSWSEDDDDDDDGDGEQLLSWIECLETMVDVYGRSRTTRNTESMMYSIQNTSLESLVSNKLHSQYIIA